MQKPLQLIQKPVFASTKIENSAINFKVMHRTYEQVVTRLVATNLNTYMSCKKKMHLLNSLTGISNKG